MARITKQGLAGVVAALSCLVCFLPVPESALAKGSPGGIAVGSQRYEPDLVQAARFLRDLSDFSPGPPLGPGPPQVLGVGYGPFDGVDTGIVVTLPGNSLSRIDTPGVSVSQALGISNNGSTAVGAINPSGSFPRHAAYFNPALALAGTGTWTQLQEPVGAIRSGAYGVNDNGQVAGFVSFLFPGTTQGSLWSSLSAAPTVMPLLPGATSSGLYGINSSGKAVGYSRSGSIDTPVTFDGTSEVPLILSNGATTGVAYRINDSGRIVGVAGTASSNQPMLWLSDGTPVPLGMLDGSLFGAALDINNSGLIVGTAETASGARAFISDGVGPMIDLNTLVDGLPAGFVMTQATGINSQGDIVGFGVQNGATYSFYLTALPLPPSAILMLFGLATISWKRRYRFV